MIWGTCKLFKEAAGHETGFILRLPRLQVEFYMSDSNLPRDAFLKEKVAADPEVSSLLSCVQCAKWFQLSTWLGHDRPAFPPACAMLIGIARMLQPKNQVADKFHKCRDTFPLSCYAPFSE